MADGGEEVKTLEFTPSWVVALVCFGIILFSLAVDGFLRCVGQLLKNSRWKTLVGAFRKIKEELMLLGFISLFLAVCQTRIGKICISERLANKWLPCKKRESSSTTAHFTNLFWSGETRGRRLLAEASASTDFCTKKGKVPLLTVEALHHLDIFIFVLATFHVILCVFKILLGYEKLWHIRLWKILEDHNVGSQHYHELQKELGDAELLQKQKKNRGCLASMGNKPEPLGWMSSFFKQFYPSVTKFEYQALHLNFMAQHLNKRGGDFHRYITDAVKKDFEKIVGIRWYLWIFAVIYLLVNVAGWHAFFWISFMPLTLLLVAGTILEHMITRLAEDVAEKYPASANPTQSEINIEELVVEFRKCYFWFRNPQFVINLIHIVLFENSLQLAFFFFILFQYDFHSCIMGKVHFVVPRVVVGVFVQFMCIYRTLPLYAIMKSQIKIPPNEKQSDKQNKSCPALETIEMHLTENQSERLARLKENEMDEEEETWIVIWISKGFEIILKWIVTWISKGFEIISKWIDEVKNRRKETRSKKMAATAQTDSRGGSV